MDSVTQPRTSLKAIMRALWRDCGGLVEFRAIDPPVAQKFAPLSDVRPLGAFLHTHDGQGICWGVATRIDASSGSTENCLSLPALFVDIDFKRTPEDEARTRLADCPCSPSLVIRTGFGLHVYWFLHEPYDVQQPAESDEARTMLARLSVYFESDPGVIDVARVLRVPGSRHFGYDPPRLITVEWFDETRRYDPEIDFDAWLPPAPPPTAAAPFTVPPDVRPGARNRTLFTLGRSLKAKQLPAEAIDAAVRAYNATLDEPHGESEVCRVLESIRKRRDRRGFREAPADEVPAAGGTPDPAASPATGEPSLPLAGLLDELCALVARFVVMDDDARTALALWTVHTYCLEVFEHTPYVHVRSGTKRAGKSLLLKVLAAVVHRPWLVSRVTTAALVRKIDADVPTVLLDEVDQSLKRDDDYKASLAQVLDAGFMREGTARVCVGDGATIAVVDLRVFSAKALASIGDLPDVVADRAIVVKLRRRGRHEPIQRARARNIREAAAPLLGPLAQWGAVLATSLRDADPPVPEVLDDRQQDIWAPLLAVADAAGAAWGTRARDAAAAMAQRRVDTDWAVQLLADVRQLVQQPDSDVVIDGIVSADRLRPQLVRLPERPWRTWGRTKQLSSRALAGLLGQLDLFSGQYWAQTEGVPVRGYRLAAVQDAFDRYLAPDPPDLVPIR